MEKTRNTHGGLFLTTVALILVGSASIAAINRQPPWPVLETLQNYPTAGKQCPRTGNAAVGSPKAQSNSLKNRYKLPTGPARPIKFREILAIEPPMAASETEALPLGVRNPNAARFVSVAAFVQKVSPGGISSGESCNCKARTKETGDTHIDLVIENLPGNSKGTVIAEVTFRTRFLAEKGFLKSDLRAASDRLNKDWSTDNLRRQMQGRWVRIEGWLFYDSDHHLEDWKTDPTDKKKKDGSNRTRQEIQNGKVTNWRGTCFEIHPVMAIQVLPTKPADP